MSWLAVLSLCASYLFFTAPLGIALGFIAKSEIDNNPDTLRGRGVANAAIIIGIASFLYLSYTVIHYRQAVSDWAFADPYNATAGYGHSPKPEYKLIP